MATAKSVIHYSAQPARNIWEIMEGNEIHIYLKVVRQLLCLTNVLYHSAGVRCGCSLLPLWKLPATLILALKIQHLDFHSARSTTGSTLTYLQNIYEQKVLLNFSMLTKHLETTGRKIPEIMSNHNTTNSNAFFHFQKINMKKENKTACKFTVPVSCYQR